MTIMSPSNVFTPASPRLPRRSGARSARRGVALLLVLATLLIVVVSASVVAHAAGAEAARRRIERAQALADDLAEAALVPAREWLSRLSADAVVHPDHETSMIVILDEAWTTTPRPDSSAPPAAIGSDGAVRVRITAWDQHAMVPWHIAGRSSGLGSTLPDDVRELVASIPLRKDSTPGADLVPVGFARAAFPHPDPGTVTAGARPAFGELVATHAPAPGPGMGSAVSLNVNTAPRALLEAAAQELQVSLPDTLWQRRAEGRPFKDALPMSTASTSESPTGRAATFTTSSTCWSIRVDATADRSRSSWWLVFRRGDRGEWEIVQRIPILMESIEWPQAHSEG